VLPEERSFHDDDIWMLLQVIVPFVVKADGKGLLDTVIEAVSAYESEAIRTEVRTCFPCLLTIIDHVLGLIRFTNWACDSKVIHAGCGGITSGDVDQAITAGDCTILAFNVGFANPEIQEMARQNKVGVTIGFLLCLLLWNLLLMFPLLKEWVV